MYKKLSVFVVQQLCFVANPVSDATTATASTGNGDDNNDDDNGNDDDDKW